MWLLVASGMGAVGEARAVTSSGDYTCTTDADGTLNCTGTKGPSGDDSTTGGQTSAPAATGSGLLAGLTGWFSQAISNVWGSFVAFCKDMLVMAVGSVLGLFATMVEAIPIPDFIKSFSLTQILGAAGPDLGYYMALFKFPEGFAAIGSGYAFRLLRKLLTLFQW